jgi:dihydropteroate synthase
MGILNVTPDSFSDGGRFSTPQGAIDAALIMAAAGADVIDVGGESTRPGADPVSAAEERRRILPVIRGLVRQLEIPVSIDTYKAEVARAALDEGAAMVNDISGLRYDPALAGVAAAAGAGVVLMHTRGRPADMYGLADYGSVVDEVAAELAESLDRAGAAGIARNAVVIDPGLGFAKRADHSLTTLAHLDAPALLGLDRPMLVGASRKSFLTAVVGKAQPADRDWATAAAVSAAVLLGAHMVRVHRVPEMVDVVRLADAVCAQRP